MTELEQQLTNALTAPSPLRTASTARLRRSSFLPTISSSFARSGEIIHP